MQTVTGAFSYTGKYVARRLLAAGEEVRTLTGHPDRPDPFGGRVRAFPYRFDDPAALAEILRGTTTLYNTYWVRFERGGTTYARAVENTRVLFRAARAAGVERVVHVSIANPDAASPWPYYRGKALLEADLAASGLSHAILRPTVIFGREDILLDNIAWFLRRFPAFAVPGDGRYGIRPIHVEDMADLAVSLGRDRHDVVVDAVGPEAFAYVDLVRFVRAAIGSRAAVVRFPPAAVLAMAKALGLVVGDVVLTSDEIGGLMAGLLDTKGPPAGTTRLTDWVRENRETLGRRYASEVSRHFDAGGEGARP